MSIAQSDIKLMASERLTDYEDGGGEMTGAEIVDGVVNNLFPDISRLDRVYGRVSLRKAFTAVMTDNTDMYYGGHVIITDPPDDNNVHVTLFSTGDFYDERVDARDRIESYVTMGSQLLLRPLGDQLEGQRAITCFQAPGGLIPEIGDTLVLLNSASGVYQYIKVADIQSEPKTFVHINYGKFTVDMITLGLTSALQATFPGIDATPYTTQALTRIHTTVVADASSYYGVRSLAAPAEAGKRHFYVDSIYNQLVPTSDIETALVDQMMGGDNVAYLAKGPAGSMALTLSRDENAPVIHLWAGVVPGSLSITILGYAFRDLRGRLVAVDSDGGFSGYVDYASGQITIERSSAWSGEIVISATPAVAVSKAFVTREIPIELANRAYNYTPMLVGPLPAPGSITVSYRAQGKWYELRDDGKGVFGAIEEGIGTGTVDYASGSCIITLGALPDVGTSLLVQWGHGLDVTDHKGTLTAEPMMIRHQLPDTGIKLGSVAITWTDGVTKTATDNGQGGFTGDAVGSISYGSGELLFSPLAVPPSSTEYSISYEQETADTAAILDPTVSGNNISFTIPNAPLRPGSISLSWGAIQITKVINGFEYLTTLTKGARDDGLGSLYDGPTLLGTINYTTGAVEMQALSDYSYQSTTVTPSTNEWGIGSYNYNFTGAWATQTMSSQVDVTYAQDVVATWVPKTSSLAAPALTIDLLPSSTDEIVPGSIVWSMAGSDWYDDGMGNIYRDRDNTTGAGTLAGEINYGSGLATLTTYPALSSTAVTLTSLLSRNGGFAPVGYVFRTPGAPVRDGSLSLRSTQVDGTLITANAETSGTISATGVSGEIDTTLGLVRVNFGELVEAAGNETEPWYDASLVENGMIWKPYGVLPETALYNCVVYTSLPLDADLVGIEPIRLPSDGRVPIFKSGMVTVLHHTDDELLPNPLSAGQLIALSRGNLALVTLTDQVGLTVDETLYTADLAAGTITMANPLDLTGYTEPLVAAHRIEDMVLISEAQINGYIATVGPLTHNYPAGETQVSSALIIGDVAGRIIRSFTQKTWDGTWQDTRIGDDTTAKYDDKNYPFVLTNKGSIGQRWVIKFTGSTTFDVIGERVGVIASGTTTSNCAPINPATGVPYFSISYQGWGTGWATGNCLRFDTSAANYPIWLARTTMQGAVEEPTDQFVIQIRGDAN